MIQGGSLNANVSTIYGDQGINKPIPEKTYPMTYLILSNYVWPTMVMSIAMDPNFS